MSDPSTPGGPLEGLGPDEAGTAKINVGRTEASPPNTPWSAPQGGWETPGAPTVGWGAPPPYAGWTRLPNGSWSPPPSPAATLVYPPPPPSSPATPPEQPGHNGPRRRHGLVRVAVVGVAVVVAAFVGAALSHDFWQTHAPTVSQTQPGSGSSGSSSNGSGGFPFGSGSGSGSSGSGSGSSGFGSGSGSGSGSSGSGSFPFGNGNAGSGGSSSSSAAGAPRNMAAIAKAVDPAIVDINLTLGGQGGQAAATGIVLTPSGLVLTNNHVVNGAASISATDVGNKKTYRATVVGYDPSADVALIQLQGAFGLKTAQLADSSKVAVGQAVVALGNAGGVGGTPSVAGGSLVALNRQITARDAGGGNAERLKGLFQTNADIQPGDSGGPLVNASGQVIGMDTAASGGYSFRSAANQGFAVPVNAAAAIVAQIENHQASATVHIGPTAFLGVEFQSSAALGGSGSSGQSSSGATIAGVVSGQPAARAGLVAGDTIVSVDGQPVSSATALTSLLGRYQPGDRVQIRWTDQSGAQHSSTVRLASGPAH